MVDDFAASLPKETSRAALALLAWHLKRKEIWLDGQVRPEMEMGFMVNDSKKTLEKNCF